MDILSLFTWLTPSSEEPLEIAKWRQKIAATLTFVFLLLFGTPVVAFFLFETKAHADEVHEEITKELTEIKMDLNSLVLNDNERAQREKEREIREVRASILSLQTQACLSSGALRTTLNRQVGELRSQYQLLTGEEFPATNCDDLLGRESE